MAKELSQDWLNWIFENIQNGCDKKEWLDILLQEGFDASYCKVALGFDLTGDDFAEAKEIVRKEQTYSSSKFISAQRITDVSAEIYEIDNFLSKNECDKLIEEIKSELRPSTIASLGEYDASYRTSSTCDLGNKSNVFLQEIDRRICDFIGIDPMVRLFKDNIISRAKNLKSIPITSKALSY